MATNNESKPKASEEKESVLFGIRYVKVHLYAFLMLAFAATQFFVLESEKAEHRKITLPTAASERQPGKPIYVTGTLRMRNLQSEYVKPGSYLRIEQVAEVYGYTQWKGSKGKVLRGLDWTSEPKDPRSFGDAELANEPFYKLKYQTTTHGDENATIEQSGVTYGVDTRALEPNFAMTEKAPEPAPNATHALRAFGANSMHMNEWLYLYENEACLTEPRANCQRVRLRVIDQPTGIVTVIGDLKEKRLIAFNERILIGPGDLKAVLDKAYIGTENASFSEFGYFLLVALALFLARDLTQLLPVVSGLSTIWRTLLMAVLLSVLLIYAAKVWYLAILGLAAAWYLLNKQRLGQQNALKTTA